MAAPSTPSLAYKLETLAIDMLREHESLAGVPITHHAEDTRAEINRIVCKATLGEQEQGGIKPWNVTLEIQAYVTERDAGLIEDYSRAIDETFTTFPAVDSLSAFEYLTFLGEEEEDKDGGRDTRQRVKTYNFHARETTPPAPEDEDVAAWVASVTGNGGTYNSDQYSAISAFVEGCKSDGIWDLLTEVYPFAGENFSAACVKLKNHSSSTKMLTPHGFAEADYTPDVGINLTTNASKFLDGIPTLIEMSLSGTDLAFGLSRTDNQTPASATAYLISDCPPSGQPEFYAQHQFIGAGGGVGGGQLSYAQAVALTSLGPLGYHSRRFRSLTHRFSSTYTMTGVNPINIFRTRRVGSYFYATGKLGFAFFGHYLTEDQSGLLMERITALLSALGRAAEPPTPRSVFLGDSITAGAASTGTTAVRFSALCAANDGNGELNLGVPGGTLTTEVDREVSGNVLGYDAVKYAPSKVYIMYGVNDSRLPDGLARATPFGADLKALVAYLITQGIAASNIVIGSLPFVTATPTGTANAYASAALAAAQQYHTKYADVQAAMVAGGGATLLSGDGVHPNNAGHAVIAAALNSATVQ